MERPKVIAVDLDGTLAYYDTWKGLNYIGTPILPMVDRVQAWLKQGHEVRIFTARLQEGEKAIPPIRDWLAKVGLPEWLEITNIKTMDISEFWDDRAYGVEENTGRLR